MFRRKKTVGERERERVEAAELARRVRAGEPMGLVGEAATRPDREVREAALEYGRKLRAYADASYLPDPEPERPMCEKHGYSPPRRHAFQPRPSVASCPECLAELDRTPVGVDVYIATPSSGLYPTKDAPPQLDAAWQAKLAERERAGEVLPGSEREAQIVYAMDEARRRERGGSRLSGGAQRFEAGEIRVWRPGRPPRRRRSIGLTVEA